MSSEMADLGGLRYYGQPWRHRVNIKRIMERYPGRLTVEQCAARVVVELRKAAPFQKGEHGFTLCSRLLRVRTEEGFNSVLADIYDYADDRRVWLG